MLFQNVDFDEHEQVIFCHDAKTGLRGIIAIHSTALGPAAGGCRMYPYASDEEALTDVLRLSKGMTYKNSVAGLPLGGGKCVIIGEPNDPFKPALLRSFAKYVQSLQGHYWTAIDVGVGPGDADIMAEECDYVFARASQYEEGFNPSAFTAYGGFKGIQAAAKTIFGNDDLKGVRIAVQGLGATGYPLCQHLSQAGAELIVCDIRDDVVERVVADYGASAVSAEDIHKAEVDIFAPCAMGAILNDSTIPEIKAKVICGLANNQLAEERHGEALRQSGIAYVPDYVVNAGGMMGASTVIFSAPSRDEAYKRIDGLYKTITEILTRATKEETSSSVIADQMARERIQKEGRK